MKGNGRDGCCKSFLIIDNPIKPPFDLQLLKVIAELTLAPSRDEILLVRPQEPTDRCLSDENKLAKFLVFHWAWSLTKPTITPVKSNIYNFKDKRP